MIEQLRKNRPVACVLIEEWGLDEFCEAHGISKSSDPAAGLVSLKYGPSSPMDVQAVQDCRGLILYENDPIYPVCMPFRKFFNLGEPLAHSIHWDSAVVTHKLDGSLMMLYYDHKASKWRVGTSGNPTAGGNYNGLSSDTFHSRFWNIWASRNYKLPTTPLTEMDDVWYFFELCSPDNRIVVMYDEPDLRLIGARRRVRLQELSYSELEKHAFTYRWNVVETDFGRRGGADFIKTYANCTDPMKLEGFVVTDQNFNRVKVKNPRYVEIHHLRGQRSPRSVVELWKQNEVEEVLTHFPELAPGFQEVLDPLLGVVQTLHSCWKGHRDWETRKAFAIAVKDMPFSSVLFSMYTNREEADRDPSAYIIRNIMSMNTQAILRNLGI